jgi:glucosamine-6-phosphate deaminase
MRIIIEVNYQSMSKKAALLVASQVNLKPDSVLGLATGDTPLGMYRELIKMYQRGEIDFSEVITFNLDEYYRLPSDNPQSYHYYMEENFFKHVNLHPRNTHIPDGMAEDIEKECVDYEERIRRSGGIDLQVLGIGSNGHVGFNEPGEQLNVTTHLVDLSEETIKSNSRFFNSPEEVPKKAISVGMATILKASRIILLASGTSKAEAIKQTVSGHVDTRVPSSLLQTHPEVTLIVDQEAASLISC